MNPPEQSSTHTPNRPGRMSQWGFALSLTFGIAAVILAAIGTTQDRRIGWYIYPLISGVIAIILAAYELTKEDSDD